MSLFGQKLRNHLPEPSVIVTDDSSTGAMLLSVLGEHLQNAFIDVHKVHFQNKPLSDSPVLEPGTLHFVDFTNSKTFIDYLHEIKDPYLLRQIDITASLNNETYNLTRLFEYSDLCKVFPNRIEKVLVETIENVTMYQFQNTYNNIVSDKLYLHQDGTKIYFDINDINEYQLLDERKQNADFLLVAGYDIYGTRIQEVIYVNHEGLYETRNKFVELLPLEQEEDLIKSDSIELTGLKGNIKIKKLPINVLLKKHLFIESTVQRNADTEVLIQNNLFLNLSLQNNIYYLDYIHRYFDVESKYKNEYTNVDHNMFESILFSKAFVDSDLNPVDIEDYCFDYLRNKLLTIDSNAKLRWYNLDPNMFIQKEFHKTIYRSFSIDSFTNRASIYENININFLPHNNHANIKKYFIARRTPSSKLNASFLVYNFEYLQSDLHTWSTDMHVFEVNSLITENSSYVLNQNFTNYFDEFGQYDFYIFNFRTSEAFSLLNKYETSEYTENKFKKAIEAIILQKNQKHITIDSYSILVEYFVSEKEMQTSLTKEEDESFGIFIKDLENNIYTTVNHTNGNSTLYHIKEYKDYFAFNNRATAAILLEKYDSLTIKFNNTHTESVEYA